MYWAKFPGRKKIWAILSMGENGLGETSGGEKILGQTVDGRKKLGETTGAKSDWAKIPGANLPVTVLLAQEEVAVVHVDPRS